MGQVVQVNGDYRIKTSEGGTIFLDTGTNLGKVSISGTVEIAGQTLTLGSEQLNIRDNILIINFGETSNQVSLNFAGIDVDRGISPSASFLFDESTDTWQLALGSAPGPFDYSQSFIRLKGLTTSANEDGGDLILSPEGSDAKIKVDIANYEGRVKDDNDIPNKRYVDKAIIEGQALTANRISALDTLVVATDRDAPGSIEQFEETTPYTTFGQSAVSFIVDEVLTSQFYKERIELFDLEIRGFELSTRANITDRNIVIRTQGTGKLETNYAMQFNNVGSGIKPSPVNNSTVLYGIEPGVGGSGLVATNSAAEGELTTSNRALLLSMIF